ncbi:hypothetical protein B296_00022746 [Ensete ventricosum]|uniref:Uncharacterized protein n=1 Tax=Ensete ventricosum TaxID=4639 RepID=A0A426YES4_ENSVE|nr:hypothetical protein B296_00022746 [Ensete ventricosum]
MRRTCAIYRVPCLARHSTRDGADALSDDICTPLSTGNVRIVYVSRAGESITRDLVTVRCGFALTIPGPTGPAAGSAGSNGPGGLDVTHRGRTTRIGKPKGRDPLTPVSLL